MIENKKTPLPDDVRSLVRRVLTSTAARSSPDARAAVYHFVAALTRNAEPAATARHADPYLRKVALHAYKVLDREVDAMRAAGCTVDDIFEMTVAAAVSAGVTRLEIAMAALEEAGDAAAS